MACASPSYVPTSPNYVPSSPVYIPATFNDPITDMKSLFFHFKRDRLRNDYSLRKFSINELFHMFEQARIRWSPTDPTYHCLGIEGLAKWKLGIKWLEQLHRVFVETVVTEFHDVYEDIARGLENHELQMFKKEFLVLAAKATALDQFIHPHGECGQYRVSPDLPLQQTSETDCFKDLRFSVHGISAHRCQKIYVSTMQARGQAPSSRRRPSPAGYFNLKHFNTDCWFEILKLLNAKDCKKLKGTSIYMYNCINALTLYCDSTRSKIYTKSFCCIGNRRKFQQVAVSAETMKQTMEAQPLWHLEIHGARNANHVNGSISPAFALIKAMTFLSHPRRVVQISIDSMADAAFMLLVWDAFLGEFRNLRHISIINDKFSESLPSEAFEVHEALHGLNYEVDVINQTTVLGGTKMLWVYPRALRTNEGILNS